MFDLIKKKNLLMLEGRLLARGEPSSLTAKGWLDLYDSIDEDSFVGEQRRIAAGYALAIRKRNPELAA